MSLKDILLRTFADACYYTARKLVRGVYAQDGLVSVHCHEFMTAPAFERAYARGVQAIGGIDAYRWHWRIHTGLWTAASAVKLDGDFIECGVNKGFLSSAIMEFLNWNETGKHFYLLDTFSGISDQQVSVDELRAGARQKNDARLKSGFYVSDVASVTSNFSQWKNTHIIQGAIPATLGATGSGPIAYLHLDMNSAAPEVAAATFFWDRLVPGAFVLLDDYAYRGFGLQKLAMDKFAAEKRVAICSLPTGQGLFIKPPT